MPYKIDVARISLFRLTCVVVAISLFVFWGFRQYKYQTSPIVPDRRAIVIDTIELMRTNSIVGTQVNWDVLQEEALGIAERTGNEVDLDNAIERITALLQDGHSAYFSRAQSESFFTSVPESSTTSITSEASEVDGVPQVSVNGFLSMDSQLAYVAAENLREQVDKAIAATTCGIIVDLTENSGGNMYPMLSGLLPLFPDGLLLQFESAGGTRTAVRSNAGAIEFGNRQIFQAVQSKYASTPKRLPTAIILGQSTGSAGEMVAIAFKGRDNSRSFGQPTAGAVTGNTPFKLKHGGLLTLATSWTLDSQGRKYIEALTPDETIAGFNSASKARKRAANWVRLQCGIATP